MSHTANIHAGADDPEMAYTVRGKHYTEWISTIDDMRKEERDDDALDLLWECIDAAERESRAKLWALPPYYTLTAAKIYRKRGDLPAEVAVLERFMSKVNRGFGNNRVEDRLAKVRSMAAERAKKGSLRA